VHLFSKIASAATLALFIASPAWSAGKAAASAAQQQYQQERQHCLSGQSQQDRATCLKEAQSAYQEARKASLGSQSTGELSRNATQRCDAQPAADRAACVDRLTQPGATSGNIKAGGLIRETETKLP
jgi:hypothetical protein